VPGVAAGAGLPADAGAPGPRAPKLGRFKIGADGELSPTPGGIGWRGPESTWPGRGCGSGRTTGGAGRPGPIVAGGAGETRGAAGACGGVPGAGPTANGGRMGSAGRPAGRSGAACGTGSGNFSSMAASAGGRLGGPPAATSGVGGASTAAGSCSGVSACSSGAPYPSAEPPPSIRRNLMATSSSIELEWVFFSVTPNSGSLSRISWALTSSSRASSLIRTFFIDTKLSRGDAPYLLCDPPSSDSS
jgi:hypothetical protein